MVKFFCNFAKDIIYNDLSAENFYGNQMRKTIKILIFKNTTFFIGHLLLLSTCL